MTERESLSFDVVIVGAGPAGLAAAIQLCQLGKAAGESLNVCVVEKGAEVGAHLLSGALLDPRALAELFPDWRARGAPVEAPVDDERLVLLTRRGHWSLPALPQMSNAGNSIVSLGRLCQWLGREAEALGVQIFPGFSAAEVLFDAQNAVSGVRTGDMGLNRQGKPGDAYAPGVDLHAPFTLLAEGCRGSLSGKVVRHFSLDAGRTPPSYGLGLKELWEDCAAGPPGAVLHTLGWPLDRKTYGGGFLYRLDARRVAVGFIVGLDYANPWLSPFEEFQRFKTHPLLRSILAGGRRIAYGARALCEGGHQALPKLAFPGGALIGDGAGFLNVVRLKGIDGAIQSGMLAAQAVLEARRRRENQPVDLDRRVQDCWLGRELFRARNIRPAFRAGLWPGMAYAALDTLVFRGWAPWTLGHPGDHKTLKEISGAKPIRYPKPDGAFSFDLASSLYLSHVHHREDQPVHLRLRDARLPTTYNLPRYGAPEQYYCPAGVYEIVTDEHRQPRLQIHAQNCLHCKSCDIKDPKGNIEWTVPEGGGGPNYAGM